MEDALKIGTYILLILPGFIWVQTREYHLLREKRSQFEKTLEIILWSAAIWIIACASPYWFPTDSRNVALYEARGALQDSGTRVSLDWPRLLTTDAAAVFATVCFYSFLGANLWGILRKTRYVDAGIQLVTGRDWYPSSSKSFLTEISTR
jgi:hypothetical protein